MIDRVKRNKLNSKNNNKDNHPNFLITFFGFYKEVSGILTLDRNNEPLFSLLKPNNSNINEHVINYITNSYELSKKLNRPIVSYFPYTSFRFGTGILRPETELITQLQEEFQDSKVIWRLKPESQYDEGSPLFYYVKAESYAKVIYSMPKPDEEVELPSLEFSES